MDLKRYGQINVHSINPLLMVIDDFCTQDEIHDLHTLIASLNFEVAAIGTKAVNRVDTTYRSAEQAIHNNESQTLFRPIRKRVTELFQYPIDACEPTALLRYEQGQEYKVHLDSGTNPDCENYGRIFTAVLYLNDDFSGGETVFPRIDVTVRPKAGSLVLWANKRPNDSAAHPLSLHAGHPVKSGTKYIASFWIHRPDEMQALRAAQENAAPSAP
ncbi:prolyl hydroxylase family protein [Halocynthiibacter sp.]|uniref:prolyl hydroxylase family protein n=1 Tax=Halocynthiibacter sp. TaxID=1979210 RepID=UPI003C477B42